MIPRSISASDLIAHSMNRVIRSRILGSTSCSDFMSEQEVEPKILDEQIRTLFLHLVRPAIFV